jgi:hypothetical protein
MFTNSGTGQYVYPPFSGFQIDTSGKPIMANMTLQPGMQLDRFGSEYGNFMSPGGAPYAQRALPPTNLDAAPGATYPYNYHLYEVARPFVVVAGPIAGWFGQPGLGVQFLMSNSVGTLVEGGFLVRVNLTTAS